MYKEGAQSEEYFEEFCLKNRLRFKKIQKPFDYLVNGKYVEIKSARLFTNKKYKLQHGRYECHSQKQLECIRSKKNPIICLIVTNKNDCMIMGFIRGNKYPNQRRVSLITLQRLGLKSIKSFLRVVRR